MLLPPEDYFIGAELPAHLSPFVEESEGDYIPREKQVLLSRQSGAISGITISDLLATIGKRHMGVVFHAGAGVSTTKIFWFKVNGYTSMFFHHFY